MKSLTVFTPTYNRKNTLPRLYDSLVKQTNKDFLWLIIDDGSSDNTVALVQEWTQQDKIQLQYLKIDNGGKMRAHNLAVNMCETEFFVCVDSDDYLTDDAVGIMLSSKERLSADESVAGLITIKKVGTKDQTVLNNLPEVVSLSELYASGFKGETTLMFKTVVIQSYPFPVQAGEKFITEGTAYDLIDVKYKYSVIQRELTICEYLEDGYTCNIYNQFKKSPRGYAYYYKQKMLLQPNIPEYREKFIAFALLTGDKKIIKESMRTVQNLKIKLRGFLRFVKVKLH